MSVLKHLATSLNRRDEKPNQELAKKIVAKNDKNAVKELVEHLNDKDKDIQSDCIKVLYEIAEKNPALIAPHAKAFVELLSSKNNRLQWGAMTAIDAITLQNPKEIYSALSKILDVTDKGSVITKDHGVSILIKLSSLNKYADTAFPLLIEQLKRGASNQLPMYAENAVSVINELNREAFIKTLASRLDDMEKETKRKRVEKVIKKVSK